MYQHPETAIPRQSLRIRQPYLYRTPEGAMMVLGRDIILNPNDPEYDMEYTLAVHAFRTSGQPMPYATGNVA